MEIKELRLCIRLLDIVLGEDAEYKSWLKELSNDYHIPERKEDSMDWLDAPTQWKRQPTSFPKYINARNAKRFLPFPYEQLTELDGSYDALSSRIHELVESRRNKALHLYNLIRMYRMTEWSY